MTELARLTLLRGDDLTRVQVLLAEIKASLGDPQMADMNTTLLESETLNLESLRADCLTMPFLAERRLVLVSRARQILTKLNPSEREKLLDILANLPDTAALVLVIEDSQSTKRGEKYWENARAYAWLQGRNHVLPDDVRAMVPSVLGHRFTLSYDALADGVDHQQVVMALLDHVVIG